MRPQRTYRASRHLVTFELEDGSFAAWNSLFPKVLILSRDALDAIRRLPDESPKIAAASIRALLSARLIHAGESDNSRAEFFNSVDDVVAQLDKTAAHFYRDRRPYQSLLVVNSACNLKCPYCVSRQACSFRPPASRTISGTEERYRALLGIVDQYLGRKRECRDTKAGLGFNGGEILLHWPLIERILAHVERGGVLRRANRQRDVVVLGVARDRQELEGLDPLRLVVLEDLEVRRRQVVDRPALVVDHRHVDADDVGARAEGGRLIG